MDFFSAGPKKFWSFGQRYGGAFFSEAHGLLRNELTIPRIAHVTMYSTNNQGNTTRQAPPWQRQPQLSCRATTSRRMLLRLNTTLEGLESSCCALLALGLLTLVTVPSFRGRPRHCDCQWFCRRELQLPPYPEHTACDPPPFGLRGCD